MNGGGLAAAWGPGRSRGRRATQALLVPTLSCLPEPGVGEARRRSGPASPSGARPAYEAEQHESRMRGTMTMVPCPRGNRPWRDHANWSRMFVKPLEVACTIVVRDADLRGCEGGANDCRARGAGISSRGD